MVKPGWLTEKVQQNSEVFRAGARMVSGFNVLLGVFVFVIFMCYDRGTIVNESQTINQLSKG